MRTTTAAATLLAAFVLTAGCSSQNNRRDVPDPGSLPKGASFQGVWYSQQFEHMYLRQSGSEVRGVYEYEGGGRFEGTVDGDLLKGEWVDPGNKQKAEQTQRGKAYLKLVVEDGEKKLEGEWGYEDQYTGGGPWNAEYIRELDQGDPSAIDELE